jgi:hypothetical protein
VYNGDYLQSSDNPLYTIQMPCFTTTTNWNSKAIQSFVRRNQNNFIKDGNANGGNTFWSLSENDGKTFTFKSSVAIITEFGNNDKDKVKVDDIAQFLVKNTTSALGEYKLSLDAVDYLQCVQEEGGQFWEAQSPYPRVCEVNFSVTEPYILQKTPSGTINATTTVLDRFKMYADGTQPFTTLLSNILAVNANDYAPTTTVKNTFDTFINKYSKLAVKVDISSTPLN